MGVFKQLVNFENLITSGLTIYADAQVSTSYPGTGTSWFDLSGNNNTGTLFNSIIFTTGTTNYFTLDGVNDYIQFPTGSTGNNTGSFTMSTWVSGITETPKTVLLRGQNSGDWSLILEADITSTNAGVKSSDNTTAYAVESGVTFNSNGWYYLTAVWQSNDSISLYVNGIFQDSTTLNKTTLDNTFNGWNIGRYQTTYYNFNSAEVDIYSRALSSDEILQNFTYLLPKYYYDSDAENFIVTAGITNTYEKNAIYYLVNQLKKQNLWNKMFALYPFVGGTSNSNSYNLIDRNKYQITWSTGVTHNLSGITGNGTSGYGQTGFIPSVVNSTTGITDSLCFSVFSNTAIRENSVDIGVDDGIVGGAAIQMWLNSDNSVYPNNNGTNTYNYNQFSGATNVNNNSDGHFVSSRTAINLTTSYYQGNSQASNSTSGTTTDISTQLDKEIYLLATNSNGTAKYFSTRNLCFAHISKALTSTEVRTLFDLLYTTQNFLKRQILI
jgi:hypothetical protein